MANIKISELNELTQEAYDDYLPIVDTSADETKKISVKNLTASGVQLIAVTDTEPEEGTYQTGDKYYNTTNNKIYTAKSYGWDLPETPIRNIFYIILDTQNIYTYDMDNETLVSVGGGAGGETLPVGTEVDFDGSASDIPIGWEQVTNPDSYSTSEVKTNKTWIDGKPIYRVCKNIGYLPNNGRIVPSFEGLIPTTATITKLDGITHRYANDVHDYRPLAEMVITFLYRPAMSALYVDTNQDVSNWECIAIIEYTKTTD